MYVIYLNDFHEELGGCLQNAAYLLACPYNHLIILLKNGEKG